MLTKEEPYNEVKDLLIDHLDSLSDRELAYIYAHEAKEDCYLWPNGDLCTQENLEEYLTIRSDDYEFISKRTQS